MFDWYDDPDHNDPVENTWPVETEDTLDPDDPSSVAFGSVGSADAPDEDENDPVQNTWPCPKCDHPFFAHNETGCHAVKWNQTFQCPESCKCEYWHNEKEEG